MTMSASNRRLLAALLVLLATMAFVGSAGAQEGPGVSDDDVNEMSEQLYCPICENVPLDVCPTQACADWRAEVRQLLEAGRSEDEIKQYFVERYGTRVLGEPPRTGFTSLVWILPFVGLAAGVLLLGRSLFQMRRASATAAPRAPEEAVPGGEFAAYAARLEQELREFSA